MFLLAILVFSILKLLQFPTSWPQISLAPGLPPAKSGPEVGWEHVLVNPPTTTRSFHRPPALSARSQRPLLIHFDVRSRVSSTSIRARPNYVRRRRVRSFTPDMQPAAPVGTSTPTRPWSSNFMLQLPTRLHRLCPAYCVHRQKL